MWKDSSRHSSGGCAVVQQVVLRAVLPCQERVKSKTHPLLIDPEPASGDETMRVQRFGEHVPRS